MKIKSSWLYYTGRFIFYALFKTLWRCEVSGHGNIPAEGGVIISPNHKSYADPPLTGSSMKRPLHFMAKEELFSVPVLGFLIKRTNAFPVNRGTGDVGAFKNALSLLENGECLLVFPEGTRAKTADFGPAKQGVGMLACMAQVPVVPARLFNTGGLFGFKKIRVIFGKPLLPPKEYTKDDYRKFSGRVLDEIKKLG